MKKSHLSDKVSELEFTVPELEFTESEVVKYPLEVHYLCRNFGFRQRTKMDLGFMLGTAIIRRCCLLLLSLFSQYLLYLVLLVLLVLIVLFDVRLVVAILLL